MVHPRRLPLSAGTGTGRLRAYRRRPARRRPRRDSARTGHPRIGHRGGRQCDLSDHRPCDLRLELRRHRDGWARPRLRPTDRGGQSRAPRRRGIEGTAAAQRALPRCHYARGTFCVLPVQSAFPPFGGRGLGGDAAQEPQPARPRFRWTQFRRWCDGALVRRRRSRLRGTDDPRKRRPPFPLRLVHRLDFPPRFPAPPPAPPAVPRREGRPAPRPRPRTEEEPDPRVAVLGGRRARLSYLSITARPGRRRPTPTRGRAQTGPGHQGSRAGPSGAQSG